MFMYNVDTPSIEDVRYAVQNGVPFEEATSPLYNSAYSSSNLSSNGVVDNGWFSRLLDPKLTDMQYNAIQAQIDRDFSAEQAKIQRDYEREMSNTAYQRAVLDMKKAGLNPFAVYSSGSGFDVASTPQGATAQGSKASIGGSSNLLANIINGAFTLAKVAILKKK